MAGYLGGRVSGVESLDECRNHIEVVTMSVGIEIDPRVCNGKPVVAGTRIPVSVILDLLASGDSLEDIQRKHPELSHDGIVAAIDYCHAVLDHSDVEAVPA